jgi:hypothetical protein
MTRTPIKLATAALAVVLAVPVTLPAAAQVNPQTGEATIATPGPIAPPRTPWYRRTPSSQQPGQAQGQGQPQTQAPADTQRQQPAQRGKPAAANQYASEGEARVRCLGGTVVWANLDSKIYHYQGTPYYGRTKKGAYMCERDTASAGIRAAKNQTRPTS